MLSVLDLFSGGGGASCGFHVHPDFKIIGAADKQLGKPSSAKGTGCNSTYEANIGITPLDIDLGIVSPEELAERFSLKPGGIDVLISCSPCTGFSRTNTKNHSSDDVRNSLTNKTGDFVEFLKPNFVFIENARELLRGNFDYHGQNLVRRLKECGYVVSSSIHMLNKFGLPQIRERAIIIASRLSGVTEDSLDLSYAWNGYRPDPMHITVRNAIADFPELNEGEVSDEDPCHAVPKMNPHTIERLRRIPTNGGSWIDLLKVDDGPSYLIPSMQRNLESGKIGSYPDIYGRMAWDKPCPTIKRECSSPGNGRYCHPEQLRMCSVRELSYLQGFPRNYHFIANSLSNMYRHIGDSVPPMLSYQYACLFSAIVKRIRVDVDDLFMPETVADKMSIVADSAVQKSLFADVISA